MVKVAKVHEKIARCREDFLHKPSRIFVDENQVIIVENLNVPGMVKNRKLAKSILDDGWGMFCTMLKYKAEWSGKTYLEVDRFFASSKTCYVCLIKLVVYLETFENGLANIVTLYMIEIRTYLSILEMKVCESLAREGISLLLL